MQKIKFQIAVIGLCAAAATLLNGCGQPNLPPPKASGPNDLVTPSDSQQTNQQSVNIPVNTSQPQAVPVSPVSQPAPAQIPPGQR